MALDILELLGKFLGLIGIGYFVGREIGRAKTAELKEELRKTKNEKILSDIKRNTRDKLNAVSDDELVRRVASGLNAEGGEKPDKG